MNESSDTPCVFASTGMGQYAGPESTQPQPRERASGVIAWLAAALPFLAAMAGVAAALLMHSKAHADGVTSGDPCAVVRRDLDAEKSRDQVSATNVSQQGAKVIENAKKCMDRVRKIGSGVATPQAKPFESTIDSILSYLTNQACQIFVSSAEGVYNQVNGTVQPYVNVLNKYENTINGNIPVQDVISGGGIGGSLGGSGAGGLSSGGGIGGVGGVGGIGGVGNLGDRGLGPAVTRGITNRLPGYSAPPPTVAPATTTPVVQPTPSLWDRISCTLGSSKCAQAQ